MPFRLCFLYSDCFSKKWRVLLRQYWFAEVKLFMAIISGTLSGGLLFSNEYTIFLFNKNVYKPKL
jgi:hypothetical protein